MFQSRTCDCGIRYYFARTAAGKQMPVVYDSTDKPGGNLAVWKGPGDTIHCRVLAAGEEPDPAAGEHRALAHFADCPMSAKFSRKNAR